MEFVLLRRRIQVPRTNFIAWKELKSTLAHMWNDLPRAPELSKGVRVALILWGLFTMSGDLKVRLNPHIHWFLLPLFLIWIAPELFRGGRNPIQKIALVIAGFFCLTIIPSGWSVDTLFYNFMEAGKIGAILFLGINLFLGERNAGEYFFKGVQICTLANALLLVAGLLGFRLVAKAGSEGVRWETFLALPGGLARLGILCLIYSSYLIAFRRRVLFAAILLASSLLVIILDSSRTALLVQMLAALLLTAVAAFDRANWKGFILPIVILLVCRSGNSTFLKVFHLRERSAISAMDDAGSEVLQNKFGKILSTLDNDRTKLMKAGVLAVKNHPLVGNGFGQTRVSLSGTQNNVHLSYLQAWADIGFFGFIAYGLLSFSWLFFPGTVAQVSETRAGRREESPCSERFIRPGGLECLRSNLAH